MSAVAACASAAAGAGYAIVVTISDQTLTEVSASACSVGIRLTRGGQFHTGSSTTTLNPVYADLGGGQWADRESASVGDSYEAMLETTTGTLSSGTADSWLAMSGTLSWEVNQNGLGSKAFTGTLKIRRGVSVQDTAAISMTAQVVS